MLPLANFGGVDDMPKNLPHPTRKRDDRPRRGSSLPKPPRTLVMETPGRAEGRTIKFRSLSNRSPKDVQDHLLAVLLSPRRGQSHALFTEAQAGHSRKNPRKRQATFQPQRLFRGIH